MKMLGRVLMVAMFVGASGLRWSEKLMADTVQVCSGQNIRLFWNYTLDQGEKVKGMMWDCQPEGKEGELMATFTDDHFVPMATFSGRLAHLEDGSIELSCATILESGNYSIAVSTEDLFNRMLVYRKTVSVMVVDTPKTQSGELHISMDNEAVQDVTTGSWHAQLSCGNFSDRGHPAIEVMWETPEGVRLASSGFENGMFHLLVPNPVVGGNYSCIVPDTQKANECLPKDSPLLTTATMHVDGNIARFVVLEARQQELLDRVTAENQRLTDGFQRIINRTEGLKEQLDGVVKTSDAVNFHARMTTNKILSSGSILVLPKIITNQGNGYDSSTGRFTAPHNGTYFFIGTTGSYSSGNWANMRMMKDGDEVARTYLLLYSGYHSMGSCHAILHLKAGEQVWLQSATSNSYFYWPITFFSGFKM